MAIDLFCSFIRYGDTAMQIICMFSCLIRANDLILASPYTELDEVCLNHWYELSRKMCI